MQRFCRDVKRRTITYGRSAQADYRASTIECGDFHSRFHLRIGNADLGEFHLHVPGEHNVLNATAAIARAHRTGRCSRT